MKYLLFSYCFFSIILCNTFQNQVILTEGELRNNLGDSEKVRDLQDVVADLKAEVRLFNTN